MDGAMEQSREITLKELAALCGLSSATVSDVLNGKARQKRISQATEARVMETARRHGYRANHLAACFRRGQSPGIGVFLPDHAYAPIAAIAIGISKAAREDNIPLNFYYGLQDSDYAAFLDSVRINGNCGIISYKASGTAFLDKIRRFTSQGGNVILLNSPPLDQPKVKYLSLQNYAAGKIAARYLMEQSMDSFFCFSASDLQGSERRQGFQETLQNAGKSCECRPDHLSDDDAGDPDLKRILQDCRNHKQVGIFAWTDFLASILIRKLRKEGAAERIGSQIRIIGCDNSPFCEYLDPALTSIDLQFRKLGSAAMQYLLDTMRGTGDGHPDVPEPVLIQRKSA